MGNKSICEVRSFFLTKRCENLCAKISIWFMIKATMIKVWSIILFVYKYVISGKTGAISALNLEHVGVLNMSRSG
ncbi:hypothetical protein ACHAXS_000156 [Conticribra weissflogii]